MKKINLKIDGNIELPVYVADDIPSRVKGLQGVKNLNNEGMLFVFEKPKLASFWMRDTPLNLDIAFISRDGKINQIEKMFSNSSQSVKSQHRCYFALEVPSGYFEDQGIEVGSYIEILEGVNEMKSGKSSPFGSGYKQVKTTGKEKEIIGHT